MPIKIGNSSVNIKLGNNDVTKIALGNETLLNTDYLCIENAYEGTNNVKFSMVGTMTNVPALEYSKNKVIWADYVIGESIELAEGEKVYFRGNNSAFNESSSNHLQFISDYGYNISGWLGSLLRTDVNEIDTIVLPGCAFLYLFKDSVGLLRANDLNLNGLTLAESCYDGMFYGCTSLANAPALPATTLATKCYYQMFMGCTSLATLPANLLPAITLASNCYEEMFKGCAGLTSLPVGLLPATTLASSCYTNMFYGCISLATLPANLLPATTLATNCYQYMFYGCTSLATLPANLLPATALATNCYQDMFQNCTSLATLPANLLPATALAESCYNGMFYGCTSLATLPANLLPATTLKKSCYNQMFYGCTSLTALPLLPATKLTVDYCYSQMFYRCSKIKLSETQVDEYQIPYRVPAEGNGTKKNTTHLSSMFDETGGTFKSTPTINTTYYTSNTVA